MTEKEISKIRQTLNELIIDEGDTKYLVTLTFPDSIVGLEEADKILKRHLDVIRKHSPNAFILSTMAFEPS